MDDYKYTLHRRALIALNELSPTEQAQVMDRLAAFADSSPAEWSARTVKPFDRDRALYLVRVSPSLRLIVRAVEGQRRELVDIVRKETLDAFAKAASEERR